MNKRIEQLWCQGTHAVMPKSNGYASVSAEEIKKFAELIVRDCCQFENSYGGEAGLVARHYSRKIRKHFGVEE